MAQLDFIQAILTNDHAVLADLYRQFSPMVKKMVTDYGGSESDAKDVFQEAVIVVLKKAQQPDFQLNSQFSTFFYGIARNRWLNLQKKKSFSEVRIPKDAEYIPDETPEPGNNDDLEQRLLLYRALTRLGKDCRALLLLFFERKTMQEIASQMGYSSENYAARRKHACKQRLVELIKSYPEFQELYAT